MDELQKYLGWPLEEVKAALGKEYVLKVQLTMPDRIRHYDARLKSLRVIRIRPLEKREAGRTIVEITVGAFADAPVVSIKTE